MFIFLGSANPNDWWMAIESEPSLGSTTQLHMSCTLKGPEFAQGMLELDGPFTNVNKGIYLTKALLDSFLNTCICRKKLSKCALMIETGIDLKHFEVSSVGLSQRRNLMLTAEDYFLKMVKY